LIVMQPGERFRSSERDSETDARRRKVLADMVSTLTEEIRVESEGLGRRVSAAQAQASAILGNDSDYGEKHKVDERSVSAATAVITRGMGRLAQLRRQRDALVKLAVDLDRAFD
jgi:hypothetical protein